MSSRVIIVTGMHRSGTSLVASLLQQAGVYMGQNLIAPDPGNPRGHFEEATFVEFHDHILRRLGQDILVQKPLAGAPNEEEAVTAQRIVTQYNDQLLWGWKDPRTSLFLNFWHEQLPQARYLFIYRHPLEVTLSLLRRGTDLEALADPLAGLQTWQIYNEAVWQFYQRYPNQCVLAHVSAIVSDIARFEQLLAQKLDLVLPSPILASVYASDELRQNERLDLAWSWRQLICPEAEAWYSRLNDLADLPAPPTDVTVTADLSELWLATIDPTMSDSFYRLLTWLDPDTMLRQRNKTQQVIDRWRQKIRTLESEQQHLTQTTQTLAAQNQQLTHERDQLQQQLQAMQATQGWQWLQFYWRARDGLKARIREVTRRKNQKNLF